MKFEYDKKRCGYWITLAGNSFFGNVTADESGKQFLEFQDLPMYGKGAKDWISIELPKHTLSNDVLESLFERELARIYP